MLKKIRAIFKFDKWVNVLSILALADLIYLFFVYYLTFVEHSTLPNARVEEFVTVIVCLVLLGLGDYFRIKYVLKKRKGNQ